MSRSIEQAHRSLDALAAWSTGGSQDRPGVDEALALARIELSRIQDLASSVSSLASRSKSFLVVDDSADMRFIVARLIRRIAPDAQIAEANDGGKALEALRHAGDGEGVIVISDYDMGPGRTGIELLSEVATLHPKALRLLLTGHLREHVRVGACGPHAILHKENGLESLRKLLAAL